MQSLEAFMWWKKKKQTKHTQKETISRLREIDKRRK